MALSTCQQSPTVQNTLVLVHFQSFACVVWASRVRVLFRYEVLPSQFHTCNAINVLQLHAIENNIQRWNIVNAIYTYFACKFDTFCLIIWRHNNNCVPSRAVHISQHISFLEWVGVGVSVLVSVYVWVNKEISFYTCDPNNFPEFLASESSLHY